MKILDWIFIFLARFLPYLLVLAFLLIIWRFSNDWRRRLYYFGFTALAFLIAWIPTLFLRFFYSRPRPFKQLDFKALISHSSSPALPSGHAVLFFTMALVLFFIFRYRKAGWFYSGNPENLTEDNRKGIIASVWFIIAVVFMVTARVVVGVHWPYDIVAGFLVALLGVILANRLLSKSDL